MLLEGLSNIWGILVGFFFFVVVAVVFPPFLFFIFFVDLELLLLVLLLLTIIDSGSGKLSLVASLYDLEPSCESEIEEVEEEEVFSTALLLLLDEDRGVKLGGEVEREGPFRDG